MSQEFCEASERIAPLDPIALKAARDRWNAVAKPIGGLGELELVVEQIAGLVGTEDFSIAKRAVVVLCSDNGVVAQGVSQAGPEITHAIARSVAHGTSSVCKMAHVANIDAFSVDMGILEPVDDEFVIDRHIARGTADITKGPAMSRDQAMDAIWAGIGLVGFFKDRGYELLATGEMGIGNTTTSTAMAVAFLGLDIDEATGRGAGLSDAGLVRKRDAIRRALSLNVPDPDDAIDVIAKVGGFDVAGMVGMFIGGAIYRVPIIIDGFISATAAYAALELCPECKCAMLASHVSNEPAARKMLDALGVKPLIDAGLHLGEGTGAVLLPPLLDAALALYNGTTFAATGIDAYEVDLK